MLPYVLLYLLVITQNMLEPYDSTIKLRSSGNQTLEISLTIKLIEKANT